MRPCLRMARRRRWMCVKTCTRMHSHVHGLFTLSHTAAPLYRRKAQRRSLCAVPCLIASASAAAATAAAAAASATIAATATAAAAGAHARPEVLPETEAPRAGTRRTCNKGGGGSGRSGCGRGGNGGGGSRAHGALEEAAQWPWRGGGSSGGGNSGGGKRRRQRQPERMERDRRRCGGFGEAAAAKSWC
jgi:hypothetical protein